MEEIHHLHREPLRFGVLVAQQVGEGASKEEGGDGDEASSLPEVRPDEELLEKRLDIRACAAVSLHDAPQPPVRCAVGIDRVDERRVVEMVDVLVDERVDERRTLERAAHLQNEEGGEEAEGYEEKCVQHMDSSRVFGLYGNDSSALARWVRGV